MTKKIVGVVSLQGDYLDHLAYFDVAGYDVVEVKYSKQLSLIDALVLPGGESTTQRVILQNTGLWDKIAEFKKPIFATCAGLILLSQSIINDSSLTLKLLDVVVQRNAYGHQKESFTTELTINFNDMKFYTLATFIRAPKIINFNKEKVKILASFDGQPVLVLQDNILAATFHPELNLEDKTLAELFKTIFF